ncbi:MAG: S-layer homology domain-containing protein [Clostridia bacterium]|nr:S-layer homology domain-containing protein [Clostridia bacterium]
MNWKKLCSIMVSVLIMAEACFTTHAETTLSDRTIFDLQSLGIMQGDENGELHLSDTLTRAELAAIVVCLNGMSDLQPGGTQQVFSDVTSEDWFYKDIRLLYEIGIIKGDGDGKFRPNDSVSLDEAMKALVCVLKYDSIAEKNGGYPAGYRTVAYGIDMMRWGKVDNETALTRAEFFAMVNAVLDTHLLQQDYSIEGNRLVSDETLRDRLMGQSSRENMRLIKGIVTANATMNLTMGYGQELEDDEIAVDGVVYQTTVKNAAGFIGRSVECYIRTGRYGEEVIVSIRALKDNTEKIIFDKEFEGVENGRLTYWTEENGKKQQLQLDDGAIFVRNMRVVPEYRDADIALERGTVTLIDNNGDRQYDIVDVECFESRMVRDVRENVIYFKQNAENHGRKFINFDDDEKIMYQLQDSEGNSITPADIRPNTFVSIFESLDGSFIRIVTGQEPIDGTIDALNEENIVIDGTEYALEPGADLDIMVGDTSAFYLNFRGEVAWAEETLESVSVLKYGYIANVYADDSEDEIMTMMVLPGDFVEVEEKSDIEDDASVTLKLKGQNSGIQTMQFADKVTVDGVSKKGSELLEFFSGTNGRERLNRIVSYRTNSQGEINRISIPAVVGTELDSREEKRIYNAKEKIFGGKMLGAFGAEETTKVLMIPDYENQGDVSKKDYLASVEINDAQEYTINGYDINEDTECVRMITIMTTLQYDATTMILDKDKLSVLETAALALDEEENTVHRLTFWSDGAKKSYLIEEEAEAAAQSLLPGDLFYYAVSPSSNRISKVIRIDSAVNPDRGEGQFGDPMDINPEAMGQITVGEVEDIVYDKIDDITNRRVDRFTFKFQTGGNETVLVNSRNTPPVYQFNKRNNTIKLIETRDIVPGDGTVMVHIKNNTVRGIVYVR